MVLDIMGDLPAFLSIFGLRYWSHSVHPCPMRLANQTEITSNSAHNITVDTFPFQIYSDEDYVRDIDARKKAPKLCLFFLQNPCWWKQISAI